MKKIKIFTATIFCFVMLLSYGQVRINNTTSNTSAPNSSAFIDASSNPLSNGTTNIGKGLLFPTTDLTTFTSFSGSPVGIPNSYPTHYDGLIVYNTAASGSAGVGSTDGELSEGFWYYDNKSGTTNGGTWKPLGGGAGGGAFSIQANTPTDTQLINSSADQEKVIELVGTTYGTNTTIDLGTTHLPADTVKQFRKANIYDNTGALVLVATGDYNATTNVLVTGNGMMNMLLPAASDYKVELFYTAQ